jgi:hypothetical protein
LPSWRDVQVGQQTLDHLNILDSRDNLGHQSNDSTRLTSRSDQSDRMEP